MKIKKDKLKMLVEKLVELCVDDIELDLRNKKLTIFFNPQCLGLIIFGGKDAQET